MVISWCRRSPPVAALHLMSGAGHSFSTWNQSKTSENAGIRPVHAPARAASQASASGALSSTVM
jgi:hypothetical protein